MRETAKEINMSSKEWKTVCTVEDLVDNAGVCALLEDNTQVAIFKLSKDEQDIYAIENFDPVGKANVLYRGIVGCSQGEPFVASPLYKQQYSLNSGQCLQENVAVTAFKTRVQTSEVQIFA